MKMLIGIIVAAVLIGGGYYWLITEQEPILTPENAQRNQNVEPEKKIPEGAVMEDGTLDEPVVTITYTSAGYSPTTVTIKKGETVRWANASPDATWPASAIHPTHSIYPQKNQDDCLGSSFDACRGLRNGESWDYLFTYSGTWKFHDHVHPSKTGTVIVTE